MSAKYNVISQDKYIVGQQFIVYGIEAIGDQNIKIPDITTDRDKLIELINKCNEQSLSELHIYDVCEDFLVLNY